MTERPRPRRPVLWRLAPILVAAAVIFVVGRLYGPRPVELLVELPPGMEAVAALELRVTRPDGREILRARREREPTGARAFVVHTRLPRGSFLLEAWPNGTGPALEGRFAVRLGDEAVEVEVGPPPGGGGTSTSKRFDMTGKP